VLSCAGPLPIAGSNAVSAAPALASRRPAISRGLAEPPSLPRGPGTDTTRERLSTDDRDRAPDDLNAFSAFPVVPPGSPFPETLRNQRLCRVVV